MTFVRSSTDPRPAPAWLLLAAMAFPGSVAAQPDPPAEPAQRVGLEVGYAYWEAAGEILPVSPDLPPEQYGRFDTEGWSVGVRYLLRTAQTRSGSLWLGAGLTFFRHANTVEIRLEGGPFPAEGDLRLRGLVLGAQAEWLWRGRGPWRPFAVAGLEYQQIDASVEFGGLVLGAHADARGFGGSAGLGTEVGTTREPGRLALRALALVRWFDFGSVSWAEPTSPALSGPSYQVALGFTWASNRPLF